MSYLAYQFTVEPPQPGSEILSALIADMGFESFDQGENGFTAYIPEELNEQVDLSTLQFDDFTFTYSIEKIEQQNWNADWEKNFEPVKVDDLLLIRAPFHAPDSKVKQEIVIMPKMSFGTGHHQTTRLMCRELFQYDLKSKRVLDMGCGTGVLAILAAKLGAGDILAIDIDEWSVENSKENASENGFPEMSIKKGDVDLISKEKPFDIILANINKNILKRHLPFYAEKMLAGSLIFLSGFFVNDAEELVTCAGGLGLDPVVKRNEAEWCMLGFRKKAST